MMMQSRKQIIGLSLLMSLFISISRCNDIINVGWVFLYLSHSLTFNKKKFHRVTQNANGENRFRD